MITLHSVHNYTQLMYKPKNICKKDVTEQLMCIKTFSVFLYINQCLITSNIKA
jgi:hypothetical protein